MNKSVQKVNRLNVLKIIKNKKYKLERKKIFLRIIAGIAALITLITAQFACKKYKEDEKIKAQTAIIEQYGQESIEANIFDYIMVSEKLHNLNLNDYEISEEVIKECNIEEKLLSPSEIESLANEFNEQKNNFPSKSLDEDYNRIVLTLKLIMQEKLVNKYIYEDGYNCAHKNITLAAKKYVGEVFGVDPSSIIFEYHAPKNDQAETVTIRFIDENYNVINSYFVSGWSNNDINNDIKEAVTYMDMTDKKYDKDNNDNDEYNSDRNVRVINALKLSSNLFSKVNNNNLYSEDLNEKLTGKSK